MAPLPRVLKCFIVDDSPAYVDAATNLLDNRGLAMIGAARSIDEALAQVTVLSPDVLLVDVSLGDENGFDLVDVLHREGGAAVPTIILISTRAEEDLTDLVTASPAAGFITKADLTAERIRKLWADHRRSGGIDMPREA